MRLFFMAKTVYTKEQRHQHYLKNRERYFTDEAIKKRKEYKQNNRAQANKKNKEYYQKNIEKEKAYAADYYIKNKEAVLNSNKNWVELNKKKHKELCKEWRVANKEKFKAICNDWRKNNPEKRKAIRLKQVYGLSISDYENMIKNQNGSCLGCGRNSSIIKLHIDHCHSTGKVRGLLCFNCNSLLGHARDNIVILENLIKYLSP